MTLPRPQDLNAPILSLVREARALGAPDIDRFVAFEVSLREGNAGPCEPVDLWRFSAIVILARKRLVRYGLLRLDRAKRLVLTPRGEAFLARGLRKVNVRTRQVVDGAVLEALESAYLRTA